MAKANDFFELSHEARQKMLELALDGSKRHSDFTKALTIAPAEVSRHLQRLVNSNYLVKNSESQFEITQYGKVLFQELKMLDFISSHSKFFDTHDLSIIPKELLAYSVLAEAEILHGPMTIFEKIFQITSDADDFIYCILPEPMDPLIMEHGHQLSQGLELRLIFEEGQRVPTEYSGHRMMSLEIRDMPGVPIGLILSEKEAVVVFQEVGGKLGFAYALAGTSEGVLRWCWLLFDHYWMLGNEIIL